MERERKGSKVKEDGGYETEFCRAGCRATVPHCWYSKERTSDKLLLTLISTEFDVDNLKKNLRRKSDCRMIARTHIAKELRG